MVLDTCSVQPGIALDWNAGTLLKTKTEGLESLESCGSTSSCSDFEILTMSGGNYRLCWCAAGFTCSEASDFAVDVGHFTVVGIVCSEPGCHSDRTCISGQPCNVDGIQGLYLTDLDRVAILDTCGTSLPHLLGHLTSVEISSSVRSVTWNTDYLKVPGGFYKLCWCAGSFGCSLSEHFRVEAGNLEILGPSPTEQHRTCISGQNCILEGFSVEGPTLTDAVIVLQTCGTTFSETSLSPLSHVTANLASGSRIDFGMSFASASGGTYRLCWCSGQFSCQLPTDFRVQLGELTILGMSPLYQDRTCISGETCAIHGLLGESLSDSSRVMILNSCGTTDLVPRLTGVAEKVEDDGVTMKWGKTPMSAAGGQYRLCWCADQGNSSQWPNRCRDPLNFAQDVGTLTLLGAAPLTQDFTCRVGHTCPLRAISGEGLAAEDSVMLLDTCGTGKLPDRMPYASNLTNSVLKYMTGPYFNIIWSTVTASGGRYRLCWCSSSATCSTAEDFKLDFGTLTLEGPNPLLQLYTCTSGRACTLPPLSMIPRDAVLGEVAVLSTCSFQSSLAPPGFPDRGLLSFESGNSSVISASGGYYTLCWNTARDANGTSSDFGVFQTTCWPQCFKRFQTVSNGFKPILLHVCASCCQIFKGWFLLCIAVGSGTQRGTKTSNFHTIPTSVPTVIQLTLRLGRLLVLGPFLGQDRSCVSGRRCELRSFEGLGLTNGDEVRVMDTCGVDAAVARAPQTGHFAEVAQSGAAVAFLAKLSAAGGQYRLCWRSSTIFTNETRRISEADAPSSEFAVDMGKLDIIGPAPLEQERTCVSGQTCILTAVNGYELSDSDQWRVLDTCGVSSAPYGVGTDLVVASGMNWIWASPLSAAGGEYRLCWCRPEIAVDSNITISTNLTNDTNVYGNQSLESQALKLDLNFNLSFPLFYIKFSIKSS